MKKFCFYISFLLLHLLHGCKEENNDLTFLRPNADRITKMIKQGDIVEFGFEGLKIWTNHNPMVLLMANQDSVCSESWYFDLPEFSKEAVDSVIKANSDDKIHYLKLIDENDVPTDDHITTFKIVNNDYGNFEFYGSVFYNEETNYTLTVDYYYPPCLDHTILYDDDYNKVKRE